MCYLSLYYNDRYVADRKIIYINLSEFLIETDDLGLSINSLISVEIHKNNKSLDAMIRLPAVVCELGKNTLAAKVESLSEARSESCYFQYFSFKPFLYYHESN